MVVIGIIVLLAVGPEQLPSVIRKVGQLVSQIRSVTDGFKSDFMAGIEEIEQAADLDKLSEKIVDPFNPATFEAQSKMSKRSPDNDEAAFDDSVYANRAGQESTDSVDADADADADPDADADADADADSDIGSDEGVGQSGVDGADPDDQVDPDESQLKAAQKRQRSAAVVEAMHNIDTTPQTGLDSSNGEAVPNDTNQLAQSSSDLQSDAANHFDSANASDDEVAE